MTIPELETFLQDNVLKVQEAGSKWAEAKALHESTEDKRKPILAKLMNLFEGSHAYKEQQAYADDDWKVFLDGLALIRRDYYQAQVNYDMAKLKIDVLRTVISTRREEVKNFKG